MEARKTLAVVDAHNMIRGEDWWTHGIVTLPELLDQAEKNELTHVWICARTDLSRVCSVPRECTGWQIDAIYQDKKQKRYNFLRARRPGQRHEENIYVSFPEYSWWPWEGDDNPKVLLATVASLEEGLQLPLEWSPAHMSLEYTKIQNNAHRFWLKAPTIDLEQHGFTYGAIEQELHWPPDGHQIAVPQDATHYVEIDGNSAYAAGMTGLNVGEGDPEFIGDLWGIKQAYDGKKPGFWHVYVCKKGTSIFDGVDLPSFESWQWMSTDLIEQLRATGYEIGLDQAWVWRKYHQALRSTADTLWKLRVHWRARSRSKPESKTCENVHETLRVVIKAIHGKQHVSVRALVVARSVAMMVYRIAAIHRKYGIKPRTIKVDGLRFAVSDEHLLDEMLSDEKLGGFKLVEVVAIHDVSKS